LRFFAHGDAQGLGNAVQGGARQARSIPLPISVIGDGAIKRQEKQPGELQPPRGSKLA
jgi:hypothetical protein